MFDPAEPNSRLEGKRVLESYLVANGALAKEPTDIPGFGKDYVHLVVPRISTPNLAIRIRTGTIKGKEDWSSPTHTYFDLCPVEKLAQFQKTNPHDYFGLVVFVAKGTHAAGGMSFSCGESAYYIFAVEAEDLLKRKRERAGSGCWKNKFDVSTDEMKKLGKPLLFWL